MRHSSANDAIWAQGQACDARQVDQAAAKAKAVWTSKTPKDPAVKLNVLEERMKTTQVECKPDIATLSAENANREKANVR